MIFTTECPACEATYPIDSAKVAEGGVYARCSECSDVFLVVTPAPDVAAEEQAQDVGAVGAPEATIEEELAVAIEDEPEGTGAVEADAALEVEPVVEQDPLVEDAAPAIETTAETAVPEFVEQPAVADHVATEAASVSAPPVFGKRDPNERAARLARVLVSDMIAYHPDRHRRSLAEGTLPQEFDDEIQKSWSEYVEQVGKDLAETTPYFRDALNQVLAQGADVF